MTEPTTVSREWLEARVPDATDIVLPGPEGGWAVAVINGHRYRARVGAACDCPPCPGRGNDGHGLTHCAECCFGTGVEADPDCPIHGIRSLTEETP